MHGADTHATSMLSYVKHMQYHREGTIYTKSSISKLECFYKFCYDIWLMLVDRKKTRVVLFFRRPTACRTMFNANQSQCAYSKNHKGNQQKKQERKQCMFTEVLRDSAKNVALAPPRNV